ncbi:ANTAR domain-containing protein [Sinomonas atrocyanea]|uniref:GAF and ANTAR domain-containing protein n=1 Tax=Sinomonas atrocyanea TaxID=37927 RepID=UPI003D985A33
MGTSWTGALNPLAVGGDRDVRADAAHSARSLQWLVLQHVDLGDAMGALAVWTARQLAEYRACVGLALRRPKRPILTAGSDLPTSRLMAYWSARMWDDNPLTAVIEKAQVALRPHDATSGRRRGAEILMALPLPMEDGDRAVLLLRGSDPHLLGASSGTRRRALRDVGEARRDVGWALTIAARHTRAEELAQHRALAMESRTVIDLAMGVIMGRNRCTPDEAFAMLRHASNARNEKVIDVAHAVVAGVTSASVETSFAD